MRIDKETDQQISNSESRTPSSEGRTPNPENQARKPEQVISRKILAIVDDLFFLAKIREAGKQQGMELEVARPEEASEKLLRASYAIVVLDLNHRSGRAIGALQAIKANPLAQNIPVLGFLSHIQGELAAAARNSGCDAVMARSRFSQRLPVVLSHYARVPRS